MVRGGPANRSVKRAKIFALTKGFRGRRKNCYSLAVRAAHKKLQYAYVGRRLKKREMRKLWIQRINYASREHDISYGRFMQSLVMCNIMVNRKVLSELCIHEPKTFQALTGIAKQRLEHGRLSALEEPMAKQYLPTKQKPETETLYQTRHFVDRTSGKTVMETAV
ncbi:large ribosomal subunit protein bL20-like [Halichondria panicea]|uniref:large ribosomal subunit protein bL20-like n=1 Tax=Halichondria panicea TaxID=6063 RepID=UPI00312BC583